MGCKDPDFSSDCYSLTEEWPRVNKVIFKYNVIFMIGQEDEKKNSYKRSWTDVRYIIPSIFFCATFFPVIVRVTLIIPLRCIAVITMDSHWLLTFLRNTIFSRKFRIFTQVFQNTASVSIPIGGSSWYEFNLTVHQVFLVQNIIRPKSTILTLGISILIPFASLNSSSSVSCIATSNRLDPCIGFSLSKTFCTFSFVRLFSCKVLKYNGISASRLNTTIPTWVSLEDILKEATIEDTNAFIFVQFLASTVSEASIRIPRSSGVSCSREKNKSRRKK